MEREIFSQCLIRSQRQEPVQGFTWEKQMPCLWHLGRCCLRKWKSLHQLQDRRLYGRRQRKWGIQIRRRWSWGLQNNRQQNR